MNTIKSFFNQASRATKLMCLNVAIMTSIAAIGFAAGSTPLTAGMLLCAAIYGKIAHMNWQNDKRAAAKDNMVNTPAPVTPK